MMTVCLLVVKSKSIWPSQCCVDQRNRVAAISVGFHYHCWTIPVRPEQVAVDYHYVGNLN